MIFTRDDFRTNQIVLVGVVALIVLRLRKEISRPRFDALPRLYLPALALALGGSRPLPELFEAAGLDFDFGPDTMKRLMDEVLQELDALPM